MSQFKIKLLPDNIVNQIAAGEVVERPASVVKELVENSIDAGATKISVHILDGGKSLIQVIDNGCGIAKDDLCLAVKRHATSKLDAAHLNTISFLGFRGEALPSIASVSEFSITSRTSEDEHGWKLCVSGGEEEAVVPASISVGTMIEVRSLFHYLPARLKFLKSDAAEKAAIMSFIDDIALSYHNIEFILMEGTTTVRQYKAVNTFIERCKQIFGLEFMSNMLELNAAAEYINIKGFIGLPTFTYRNNMQQKTFINGRLVKEKNVYSAIKAAYSNIMTEGLYPSTILHIEMDPIEVDVNVHPAKTEVRLRDPATLRKIIISGIRKTLENAEAKVSSVVTDSFINISHKASDLFLQPIAPRPVISFQDSARQKAIPEFSYAMELETFKVQHTSESIYNLEETDKQTGILGKALYQIDDKYIVAQSQENLVIVDQHAAHERIVLESIKNAHSKFISSQFLLVPEIIHVGEVLAILVNEQVDLFKKYGFIVSRHGITEVAVKAVPEFLNKDATTLSDTLNQLTACLGEAEDPADKFEEKLIAALGTIACHNSIRAGRCLSITEMNAILRQIENTPLASQCNHGRPTFVTLNSKDLDKIFQRT